MRIKKIKLMNYRGTKEREIIPVEGINAILGPTGAGKSSIAEAFAFALTGQVNKNQNLIKNGEGGMAVTIETDEMNLDSGIVLKEKNDGIHAEKKFRLNGSMTSLKAVKEELSELYGVNSDAVMAGVSMEELEQMTEEGRLSSFLLSYIPEELTVDKVMEFAGEMDEPDREMFRKYLMELPEKFGITGMGEVRDRVGDDRRAAKREMAGLKGMIGKEITNPGFNLSDVRKEIEQVQRKIGGMEAKRQLYRAWLAEKKRQDRIKESLENYRKILKENPVQRPNPALYVSYTKEREECVSMERNISDAVQTSKKNISMFRTTLENLEKTVCPLSEKLVCTVDKTGIREDLQSLIRENEKDIEIKEKEIARLEKEYGKLTEKLKELETSQAAYEKKVVYEARVAELEKEIKDPGPAPETADISVLEKKLTELKNKENAALQYEKYVENLKKMEQKKTEILCLNRIFGMLKEKGIIMERINSYYISTFNSVLDERCQALQMDIRILLANRNGICIFFQRDGITRSIRDASEGEKGLIYFLVADMLNQLSGFNILFFDNIDKLDNNILKSLLSLMKSDPVKRYYDHIFLFGIDHEDTVQLMEQDDNVCLLRLRREEHKEAADYAEKQS